MGTFEFHPPVSDDDAINALALARAATRLRARGNECLLRQSGDLPPSSTLYTRMSGRARRRGIVSPLVWSLGPTGSNHGIDRYVELLARNA